MIPADSFTDMMLGLGVTEVSGVPCSYLTPLINRAASDPRISYVRAAQEGDALAFASGAWLAGSTTAVIAQNSGLGNMVNPLTSLNYPSRIPVPLIVTWRGEPGRPDEPQHELAGTIMPQLLDLLQVGHAAIPADGSPARAVLAEGMAEMNRTQMPYAFILRRGILADEPIDEPESPAPASPRVAAHGTGAEAPPSRIEVLEALLGLVADDTALVSTTGYTSRELYTLADRPQHFYLVGAMGSAAAVGLGAARHAARCVIVVDGDGAALMRLGSLAMIAAHPAPNFVHVVLDNQVHDSTGGQRSLSAQVRWPALAAACGYAQVHECAGLAGFRDAIKSAQAQPGPALVHVPVRPGSIPGLGRPTVHPSDVARRFRRFMTGETL